MRSACLPSLTLAALLALALGNPPSLTAQVWSVTSAPTNSWSSVAASADGSRVIAAVGHQWTGPYVFTSTNAGTVWVPAALPSDNDLNWSSVASSADGTVLVAAMYGRYDGLTAGQIFASTNEGSSWTPGINDYFQSVAASADGSKLVAVGYVIADRTETRRPIYLSTNSGATWTISSAPIENWAAVASSADGSKLVAANSSERIYTSTNAGATWVSNTIANAYWRSVASSADGRRLSAAALVEVNGEDPFGRIYISTDAGASWMATGAPSNYWASIASSADGTRLVCAAVGGYPSRPQSIFTSTDGGASWISNSAPDVSWASVFSSADGCKLFAAANMGNSQPGFGLIYTVQSSPRPLLHISPSNSTLTLSWMVPSINFVLQENADLSTTDWTDVPASPALNFTNLQFEVVLGATNATRFYRLKQQ